MAPMGICVPALSETSQSLFCDPLPRITMWQDGSSLSSSTTTPTIPKAAGKGSWPQIITSHIVTHTGVGHSLHYVTPSSSKASRKSHCGLSVTAPGTSHGRKQPGGSCPLAAALSDQPAGEGMGFILNLSLLLKNCNETAQSCQ